MFGTCRDPIMCDLGHRRAGDRRRHHPAVRLARGDLGGAPAPLVAACARPDRARRRAWTGVGKGTDVYLFLIGMMLLAETAREEGLFDWLAAVATQRAKGSPQRLFLLIYGVGTVVTASCPTTRRRWC